MNEQVAYFYDYGEFRTGYLSLEGQAHHMADCPSLFPIEFKRVVLQPCEAEWWDSQNNHHKTDGLFGYYKGVMFLVTEDTSVVGACKKTDYIYDLYPNSYTIKAKEPQTV